MEEDQVEDTQPTTEPRQLTEEELTHCSVCKEVLDFTTPLVTLLCECRAHTECFIIDHMSKQWSDTQREMCAQCNAWYIPQTVREKIDGQVHEFDQQTVVGDEEVVNPCFSLEKGSPEFVTDLKKAQTLKKEIGVHKNAYNELVSTTVKKYKENTKQMADILKSTQRAAIRKITDAECSKKFVKATRRFASHVARMSTRYEFGHRDWMRFTRMRHPRLYQSFYQYRSNSIIGWRLRRKFRYGL